MNNYKITNIITVSEKIFDNEYEYRFGKLKDELVTFYYDHKNRGLGKPIKRTYSKALALAAERTHDGRYKNYNFYISDK